MPVVSATHREEVLLDQAYIYQNSKTGLLSKPLTASQFILLLSPAAGVILEHITPKTNLLKVQDNAYEQEWKCADSIPVLKLACTRYHYQSATDGASLGPVSCRELSKLLENGEIETSTLVWSEAAVDEGWKSIQELPELEAVLNVFQVQNICMQTSRLDVDQTSTGVQDELEAFLQSTEKIGIFQGEDVDHEEGYQSDNGTNYIKDPSTGNWIHEALVPRRMQETAARLERAPERIQENPDKKRRKKTKFSNKHMRNWIYITGLPSDTSIQEVSRVFEKVGIIDLDPESQTPKIKIYRYRDGERKGEIKGDASLCFARPESVDLAIQLFDDAPFRLDEPKHNIINVQRAKFEQEGKDYDTKRPKISNAKRKVAKLAALQAVGWDESENGRLTGGRKGLCIVVLKHLFTLDELEDDEDAVLAQLEINIRSECEKWGQIEKLTVFSKNPQGVVILKFSQPVVASRTVKEFNGRIFNGRKIDATFWDGVTDYTVIDEEREKIEGEMRHEEFGSWLEDQELPEALRLRVEH